MFEENNHNSTLSVKKYDLIMRIRKGFFYERDAKIKFCKIIWRVTLNKWMGLVE